MLNRSNNVRIGAAMGYSTKIDDIEYLDCFVAAGTNKDGSICADRHTCHRSNMSTVLFYKLNSQSLLLPELYYAVDGCGDDEVGERSYCDVCQCVAMHE